LTYSLNTGDIFANPDLILTIYCDKVNDFAKNRKSITFVIQQKGETAFLPFPLFVV